MYVIYDGYKADMANQSKNKTKPGFTAETAGDEHKDAEGEEKKPVIKDLRKDKNIV